MQMGENSEHNVVDRNRRLLDCSVNNESPLLSGLCVKFHKIMLRPRHATVSGVSGIDRSGEDYVIASTLCRLAAYSAHS